MFAKLFLPLIYLKLQNILKLGPLFIAITVE